MHAGLIREVLEETGLTVEPERLTGVYKHMARGIVSLVFRCRVTGGTLGPTEEVREARWARADELDGLMDEAYAVRLTDALDAAAGGGPAVRAHDGVRLV